MAEEEQGSLFKRPTRTGDPETSHDAAWTDVDDLRESQHEVLLLFLDIGAMIDEELLEEARRQGVRQSGSGLRTRRSELVEYGLIEDTGQRRETRFGNESTVWGLTKRGRFLAADIHSRRSRE